MNERPTNQLEERLWEEGFEGHEMAQLRRLASLPFSLKLNWLEEAHRMVLAMEGKRMETPGSSPASSNSSSET